MGLFRTSWGPLGASWEPLGASWGPLGASRALLEAEGSKFPFGSPVWAPSWSRLGGLLGRLGGLLGRLGARLGRLVALLGASWGPLGQFWSVEKPKTRPPPNLQKLYFSFSFSGLSILISLPNPKSHLWKSISLSIVQGGK